MPKIRTTTTRKRTTANPAAKGTKDTNREVLDDVPEGHLYPTSRQEWRAWLQENHSTCTGIFVVYDKKTTGSVKMSYADGVEEALCFGWIDSRAGKVDDRRYKQWYSPRKRKSVWSKVNKKRVDELVGNGLMTEHGLVKIEQAKKDGSWDILNDMDALVIPEDLMAALLQNKKAGENFEKFAPSAKKVMLFWVGSAKRETTREERIAKLVRMAAKNLRAVVDNE